jgi:hypothetical protein
MFNCRSQRVTQKCFASYTSAFPSEYRNNALNFKELSQYFRLKIFNKDAFYNRSNLSLNNKWAGYRSRYSDWLRAGLSGDRIPVEARFSAPVQTGARGPSSLLYNEYKVFPEGKERSGRDADPSSRSSAFGRERVELHLYSPYRPYCLYRASVPVQGCTLLYIDQ